MQQDVLTYEYHLLSESGIHRERLNIPSLSGIAIEGKVLEVKKDQVRLHLSIDEAQKRKKPPGSHLLRRIQQKDIAALQPTRGRR